MADRRSREARDDEPGLAAQWVGLLLAPAVFFAHLQAGYVLVPRACVYDATIWLHVIGVASVVLAAVGMAVAWRVWQRAGRGEPMDEEGPRPRARFLGATGLGVSGLLVLLLFTQWVIAFFISPCQ